MQEAEQTIGNVKATEHKGEYGNTSGKSANSLYKNYCAYMEKTGKKPLGFKEWVTWAKGKGIIDPKTSADGVEQADNKEVAEEIQKAQDGSKRTKMIIGGVLVFGLTCFIGYKVYEHFNSKKTGN